jgi:hypothetical protein
MPTDVFPRCLIMVATQLGIYWIAHRVGNALDLDAEGEAFDTMNLGKLVKTARESGPVCEERIDLGAATLLVTLCIEDPAGVPPSRFRAYLALVEAGDGHSSGTRKLGESRALR